MTRPSDADLAAAQAALAESEARLDSAYERLTDELAAEPSRLPGWTRAVLVRHVAVNAWSNAAMIEAALRGETRPQYPGGSAEREQLIEQGRGKPAAEVVADARAAAAHFAAVAAEVPADLWDFPLSAGVGTRPLWERVHTRRNEVEIHHVDLDVGYEVSDWPADWVERTLPAQIERLPERWNGDRAAVGSWLLDAGGAGAWELDVAEPLVVVRAVDPGTAQVRGSVRGTPAQLLGWLIGRTDADPLDVTGDAAVAALPAAFPWG